MTPCALETERLLMRPWRAADLAPFAAMNADPEVMACFPAPLDRAASDALAAQIDALMAARGWGFWALESRREGAFMGFVGLHVPMIELPFSPCVEIGWRLAREYWGQGYACEAARRALRFGFEHLFLSEIIAFTALPNQRSRELMARLGMSDTTLTFEHPHVAPGSPLRTHCLYRLSATPL